jgi:hypothetical protein
MGWPTTTVSKSLLAASSTAIGSFTAAGVVTLSCATLDTARRISVAGTSVLGPTLTISGLNQYGKPISETVTTTVGPPGSGTTTQDFLKVSSVLVSCTFSSSSAGIVGTSTVGGTPWVPIDTTRNPTYVSFQLTPGSSQTQTSFEYTQSYPNYDPNAGAWVGSTNGPQPTISSLGSSVIGPGTTQGYINFPIVAWRVTFASSGSSGVGNTAASVMQTGV